MVVIITTRTLSYVVVTKSYPSTCTSLAAPLVLRLFCLASCSCRARSLSLSAPNTSHDTQMSILEVTLLVISVTQPLCVGALAYVGLSRSLARSGLGSVVSARRERLAAFRFYECATYSRLSSAFVYPISFTLVLCAYVIYDVDLALFLSEVLLLSDAGLAEVSIFGMLVVFTAAGLLFDYRLSGYG